MYSNSLWHLKLFKQENLNANENATGNDGEEEVITENPEPEIKIDDQRVVNLLCEWAITPKRSGFHRIHIVVLLLRKKQAYDIIQNVSRIERKINFKRA